MALDGAETVFIDLPVAGHDGVSPLWDFHQTSGLVGIKDDDDILPVIATGMVLQSEGHHAFLRGEELQVSAHQVGIA